MGFKRLEKNLIDIIKKNRQNLDFEKKRSVCIIH